MAKYEQLAGVHYDADNNRTVAGDVVESDIPLDKKFPDRFRKVEDVPEKAKKNKADKTPPIVAHKEELERRRAKARAASGQEDAGEEDEDEGTITEAEDSRVAVKNRAETEAEDVDLDEEEEEPEAEEEDEDAGQSKAQKRAKTLGEDVTAKYPNAKKKGLSVHVTKGGDYQVAKKGKVVKGGESLSKAKVKPFVTKFKG